MDKKLLGVRCAVVWHGCAADIAHISNMDAGKMFASYMG
jgi:hypothetical protein